MPSEFLLLTSGSPDHLLLTSGDDLLLASSTPSLDAGTLHIVVHLVRSPVVAGTLHVAVHVIPSAQAQIDANSLHIAVHPVALTVPKRIAMAGALRTAMAYGPLRIFDPDVAQADLSLEVVTRTTMGTILATLDGSFRRRFQTEVSDPGAGSFELGNEESDLAQIVHDRLVIFRIQGAAVWTMLIESTDRRSRDQAEEHGQTTTVSGRGHLAICEESVVYPVRGLDQLPAEEDRLFSWPAIDYDDSGWGFATEIAVQGSTSIYWTGLPSADWPDATARWIWASSGSQEWAPPLNAGDPAFCYFRKEFTVPAGVTRLRIYMTVDAQGDLYLDGQKLMSTRYTVVDPTEMVTEIVEVTPGTHLLAVAAQNDPDPEGDMIHNPAGVLVAVYASDPYDGNGALLVHTDGTWKIVEYADPPGMTPGAAIRILVEEAQARGALTGVTLAFSDSSDSDGQPWFVYPDIATKVGTDLLTFLRELAATYVDVWMAPASLTLYAWNRATQGSDRTATVALTPGGGGDLVPTGNLLALGHRKVS